MSVRTWLILTLACSFLLSGCGGSSNVEGIVTLDGSPVEGALVTFNPDGAGAPAVAITDAEGKFQIKSTSKKPIASGTYKVTVVKSDGKQSGGPVTLMGKDGPPDGKTMPGMQEMMKSAGIGDPTKMKKGPAMTKAAGIKSLLPAKYASVATTPFSVSLPTSDKIDLKLSKN